MNILILGIDGYIGWPLAMSLAKRGHDVRGIDNLSRRVHVRNIGSDSVFPILDIQERIAKFNEIHKCHIRFYKGDLLDYSFVRNIFQQTQPDSIIHLAEQPSAPFSMISQEHAIYTQHNNIEGNLNVLYAMKDYAPNSHLVKLGTMGEYGTPNIDIPEGFIELQSDGRKEILPFPKLPGSIYHLSKVHDSANVHFACRVWNLRATDIMQGVVYGTRTPEMIDDSLMTRFDFDECFGTVINRYCAQAAVDHPLTPYGQGKQKRGFIDLVDSIQCLTIAAENPASAGEYRVFNQLDEVYDVTELAEHVSAVGRKLGLNVKIKPIANPRKEKENHQYNVEHKHLHNLGFRPTRNIVESLTIMLTDLHKYRDRIAERKSVILPQIRWDDRELTEKQLIKR